MAKINKRIEIVSTSRLSLSSMSAVSREAARRALSAIYSDVRVSLVDDLVDLQELADRKPDLVFLGMKYLPRNPALGRLDTNRVWLSQFLDAESIAYTGSAQMAHSLEEDKPAAKVLAQSVGLNTSDFFVVKRYETADWAEHGLTYPLFVKPTDRGGGVGVDNSSVVYNQMQLEQKIKQIAHLQSDSLVEEYLPGREFSVALMSNEVTNRLDIMPLEIKPQPNRRGERILSHAAKSADKETVLPVTDKSLNNLLCQLAENIFSILNGRDYGRVDIRLDMRGVPYFLEANLLPSLIEGYGNFPKACLMNLGLSYEAMLQRIVQLGLTRQVDDPVISPALTVGQAT